METINTQGPAPGVKSLAKHVQLILRFGERHADSEWRVIMNSYEWKNN